MPRVKFNRDYDFKHTIHRLTAYKKDWEGPITTKAAEAAIAAGAAEYTSVELERQEVARENRKKK